MSDNHVQEDLGSAAAVSRGVKRGPLSGIRLAEVPPMPVIENRPDLATVAKEEAKSHGDDVGHLILTCEKDEPVHFFGAVHRVWVSEVRGGKVRLSIIAPRSTRIYRDKVFKNMQARGVLTSE